MPGEFTDSGQEILGGFDLVVLEFYAVALPQGFMVGMAVVGNEDVQNRRLPAALGVICTSDLKKPETRFLSPEKQEEINNINEQFINIQNTQITDVDNVINVINTVTTTTATTPATPTPTTPRNATGAGTTVLPSSRDTIPPVITMPAGFTSAPFEATSAEGAEPEPRYVLTAQDNVDGAARLENSSSITQDNVGGNIAISCNISSGSEFLSGETLVTCVATDQAGNAFRDSFPVTVTPGSDGGTGGGPSGTPALTGSDAPLGEDADSGTGLEEDEGGRR